MIKVCTQLPDGPEVCTTIDLAHDAASRAYTTTLGNGTDTSFTVAHNLDSLDLVPVIRDIATGALTLATPSVTAVDTDTVRLDFAAAPAVGQFQVTLLAVVPTA